MAEIGESVAPIPPGVNISTSSGAIVALADLATLEVEADVAEANVAKVANGQPAEVTVEAIPDRRYKAVLRQVIPTADRTKATVQVKVTILDKDKDLKPEMSAKVTFLEPEKKEAAPAAAAAPVVLVPRESVVTRDGKPTVFLVREGKAQARAIVLGTERQGQVIVKEGLSGGETLVLRPKDDLKDGAAVKVKGSGANPRASATPVLSSRVGYAAATSRQPKQSGRSARGNPRDGGVSRMAMVDVRNVTKVYRRDAEELVVLNGLSLQVEEGDFAALMGPSGSGKSTLLNLIAGIDKPTSGDVVVAGTDVARLDETGLAAFRSHNVGFIFQFYNLIPVLTATENVELPLLLTHLSKAERRERALTALKVVGLADRAGHYPRQLSGGQEQRVAIARAIVTDPKVLVADEPTGDLDAKSATEILDLMGTLNHDFKKTIVMVTHDPRAAERAQHPAPPREGRPAGLGRTEP